MGTHAAEQKTDKKVINSSSYKTLVDKSLEETLKYHLTVIERNRTPRVLSENKGN